MIDLNPGSMVRTADVAAIHALIDALPPPAEKRRTYVGASAIGSPCERKIQYEFLGTPHDEGWRFSARTLRIFQRGHVMESMSAVWLADAGFRLTQTGKNGQPLGFKVADGSFAGHVDRVITGGPADIAYPLVWEHKALGSKSWKALESRGLAKAKPEYADQVAVYQAYMDLTNPALFMAVNADTMEIYLELVPFDRVRAQAASDRAVAIIMDSRAGALRPRCTDDPTFYACSDCPFRKRCWGAAA
jgi:hypothetical protein